MVAGRNQQERAPAAEKHILDEIRPCGRIGLAVGPRGNEKIGASRRRRDAPGQRTDRPVEPAQLGRHRETGQTLRQAPCDGVPVLACPCFQFSQHLHDGGAAVHRHGDREVR